MPLKLNQEELSTINLTSMIDVLFLLIIFFMVGTRFTEDESSIQINLPKVAPNGAMMQTPASRTVILSPDGSIRFDGQQVTVGQLKTLLVQSIRNYPDTTVHVKSDAKVHMQQFTEVASAVQASGARLSVATAAYQMPGIRR